MEQTQNNIIEPLKKRLGFYSFTRELKEEILPCITNGTEEEKRVALERLDKIKSSLFRAMESEIHATLMESFDPQLHPWVFELASKTIEEYECGTELEKAVATAVASSHIRYMDNSKRLNRHLNESYATTKDDARYLEVLSKQVDRAHRQFLSSVMTLKQLKAPLVEVNIKAQTAFVSDRQQVNVTQHNHEIIETK